MPSARSELRLIPEIDTYPALVRFAQTPLGKIGVLAAFAVGLLLLQKEWWLAASVSLAALSFWPSKRRWLVLAATAYWSYQYLPFRWYMVERIAEAEGVTGAISRPILEGSAVALALLFCASFYAAARTWSRSGPLKRPVATLLVSYVGLLFTAFHAPLSPLARTSFWAFLTVLGSYLWFLGYALLDRGKRETPRFGFQLGYFLPFWMGGLGTLTPVPKGAGYLRRIEVRTPEELAVCQLKAIKLVFWAAVIIALREVMLALVHGSAWRLPLPQPSFALGIPTYQQVFALSLQGTPAPWHITWLALVTRFASDLLSLAGWGHVVIAVCRMAGYRALRNSCRPLRATSIAEFWNRYYYYFKELLVDFFFYPVYLRTFKGHPKLRLFFATLCAAGFGNVLFHFLRDIQHIAALGPWEALLAFRAYCLYGLLLGTAIGISQLRSRNRERHWLRERVLAPASVLAFYCVLSVFDEPDRSLSMADYFAFLATLVGVG